MKLKRAVFWIVCMGIFLLSNDSLFAQDTEAVLKSKADKAFQEESFVEASKLYSQLLAFNTRDAFYNYRYGVCLIYNSRKKQDAIKHLLFASKEQGCDVEVYYYLGRAYHLNYEFVEAISYYNKYKATAGAKVNPILEVNRQIEMSENGKRLLSSMNQMVVLEKKEIENTSFFRIYDLKDIGGDLIVNAQFQSKIDKKKKHLPLIHFPAKPTMIFYSSYGENEKNGKDIFIRRKLPDGTWSMPQTVNGGVNTAYDEDYAYLHPNGKYLYFCSKGHNSMGGYDVFRSKYDKENNTFGAAENLDFAISSPDNDLFYVVDSLDKNAYFASSRQSQDGKIHVYKVRVEQFPNQLAVVKAGFSSTINPTNKKVSVEVFDFTSNNKIGTFNSNEKGYVILTFPKGGKYEYQITVNGGEEVFKSVVSIPFLKEFKPLKQKLIHENPAGTETVKIVNLFDEQVDDPVATLAELAKMRSELNPNAELFDLNKLDQGAANKEIYAQLGMSKLSDLEVQENIQKLAESQQKETENVKNLENKAIAISVQNTKEIVKLQSELKSIVAVAETKQGSEKRELFEDAARKVNELNRLENQAKILIIAADSLSLVGKDLASNDAKIVQISTEIKEAYQKGDLAKLGTLLTENKASIQEFQKDNTDFASDKISKEIVSLREEIKKSNAKQKEYLDSKLKLKQENLALDKELAIAKTKDRPALEKKISNNLEELKMIDGELKHIEIQLQDFAKEEVKKQNQLAYYQEIQNASVPVTTLNSAEASKNLVATNNANSRTLKAYVEQQSKELGIDMYTLKSEKQVSKTETPSVDLSLKNNIEKNNENPTKEENKQVLNNTKVDPVNSDNGAKTNDLNTKNDPEITSKIDEIPDLTKKTKIDQVIVDKGTKIDDPKAKNNSEIAPKIVETPDLTNKTNDTPKNVLITPAQGETIAALSPDFNSNVKSINEDSELNEEQKLKALQRQEKDVKFLLAKEIAGVEAELKQNPNDVNLKAKVTEFQQINETLKNRIESKQKELALKYPESNPPILQTASQLTNLIKPHHNAILLSIESDNELSDMQRMDKAQSEDQKFYGLLSKQKIRIEDEITKDPLNKKNKHELELINTLISETEKRIEKRTQGMASFQISDNKSTPQDNKVNNATENKSSSDLSPEIISVINSVSPTYSKEIESIKGDKALIEKDRQLKLIAAEEKLQQIIETKVVELDKKIKANPNDQLVANEKQQLQLIQEESKNRQSESKQMVISEEKKTLKKEDLITKIDNAYNKEIKSLQAKPSNQSNEKIKIREEKLQATIQKKIAENDKKNTVKEDLKIIAENQVLNEMIEDSKTRIGGMSLELKPTVTTEDPNQIKETEQLRKELLGANEKFLNQEFKTKEDLKKQQKELESYSGKLAEKFKSTEKELAAKPENKKLLDKKLTLEKEQNLVKEKLDKINVSIGELESPILTENKTNNTSTPVVSDRIENAELKVLKTEEAAILSKMNVADLDKKEAKVLQFQLAENQSTQASVSEKQLKAQSEILKKNAPDKMDKKSKSAQSDAMVSLDSLNYMILKENEASLKEEMADLKQTKKPSSQIKLLESIRSKQKENTILSEDLIYDSRLIIDVKTVPGENINTPLSMENKETLEKRKYKAGFEIGEIESGIFLDQERIKNAKSKEKTILQRKINHDEKRLIALKKVMKIIDEEVKKRNELLVKLDLSNPSALIKVDSVDRIQLKSKANYAELKSVFEQKEASKIALKLSYDVLEQSKKAYTDALKQYASDPSNTIKKTMMDALDQVKLKNAAYLEAYKSYTASENVYLSAMKDESSPALLESLFLEKENQINETGVASVPKTNVISTPKNTNSSNDLSFKVLESPAVEPIAIRIPIGVNMPMGLVYRVQVGAFRQPLKANLFNEFTPVTGELIKTGITRYISGYFGSIFVASSAKKQIRSLGYKDAFIVAYCDGKRITIGEARRLEAKGECVPSPEIAAISTNSIKETETKSEVQLIATNPIQVKETKTKVSNSNGNSEKNEELPKTNPSNAEKTKSTPSSNDLGDYNKAPGAVKAIAVETKLGLFYTVQIGAYRNPATPKQLKNIDNVVSKKLEDGKIRYSTGIFASVMEAMPTKQMAIEKGVTDAFVTAYYKGDRITLVEAERLLKELGNGILESGK